MKTFLNVLYRRILYKIPLKFLLLLVAIFGILFACFSSADYLNGLQYITNIDYNGSNVYSITFGQLGFPNVNGFLCIRFNSSSDSYVLNIGNNFDNIRLRRSVFGCFTYGLGSQNAVISISSSSDNSVISFNADIYYLSSDFTITSGNPGYTSLQCQTEYNLIPVESVDQNYCVNNNLCPSSDCPVCPPSGGSGFSNVYINDILHVGAPNIVMNISDEIDWDYEYTAGGYNMNIDVVGYNVDYEKIDSIVQFQNYKPSSEDFQRIIGLLAPYTKIIVFFVFLFIVWAWIKKPFKSKKL